MASSFLKDPDAVLDYKIDWSDWLGSDTISESSWTVPSGIMKDSDSKTSTSATIWLSGGTDGEEYTVTNHIVTASGREEDRSITIVCKER